MSYYQTIWLNLAKLAIFLLGMPGLNNFTLGLGILNGFRMQLPYERKKRALP